MTPGERETKTKTLLSLLWILLWCAAVLQVLIFTLLFSFWFPDFWPTFWSSSWSLLFKQCILSYLQLEIQTTKQNYNFGHRWIKLHFLKAALLSLDKGNSRKGWPEIQCVCKPVGIKSEEKVGLSNLPQVSYGRKRGVIFPTIWRDIFHEIIVCQH